MMIAGGQNELRTCHTPPGPKSCCLVLIARVGLHFNSFGLKPKFVRGRIIAPGGESAPLSVIGQGYCASKYIVTIKEWCFKSQISAWKSRPQNPTPKKRNIQINFCFAAPKLLFFWGFYYQRRSWLPKYQWPLKSFFYFFREGTK